MNKKITSVDLPKFPVDASNLQLQMISMEVAFLYTWSLKPSSMGMKTSVSPTAIRAFLANSL
jgi:hypothetical protein